MKSNGVSLVVALLGLVTVSPPSRLGAADAPSPDSNRDQGSWFDFNPDTDSFRESPMDLRFLNERVAGENGFIGARDGRFIHGATGKPVRFWAVNGPPQQDKDRVALGRTARRLAKYGVNLVRRHGPVFDKDGELDPRAAQRSIDVVETMKAEGIYTHLSVYFPLWFTPRADHPWLAGYDGKSHPFAALMFNPEFQERYRGWWRAILTTPSPVTGKALIDEPALLGIELQNEDSFFFWTFDARNIPDPQLRLLEQRFGSWLVKRHGSLEAALASWNPLRVERDAPDQGRIGFRPLWNVFSDRTARDRETAAFLFEVQRGFYEETVAFVRSLGFRGLITASNWATASPEIFGPLEKWSYAVGDFIDRHGYFECNHQGDNAAWSIRAGHTYSDRSALRFEAPDPSKPRVFVHPVMDPQYDDKPSMISETTFCRPNRYRSEAPLYFAVYGALQGSDAIVHFALDGASWTVKPGYWMQPWTLMSPGMMGQFPAAAVIYRRSLVSEGEVLADVRLNTADLLQLRGTPLPQDAALDELRLADVPQGKDVKPGQRIDPLLHYAGRARVRFDARPGATNVSDLKPYVQHAAKTVTSTTGELSLDYGHGILKINAPEAQGVSGALYLGGLIDLRDLTVTSDLPVGHVVAVALDCKPLARSERILLQVMSEERETGRKTESVSPTVRRIVDLGTDPWQVRELSGTVRLKRPDAARLSVTALDFNGYPAAPAGTAESIVLKPATLYYMIAPRP
jgi:hypothetical protein